MGLLYLDHDNKLEFVKYPGRTVTSSYTFPNEYSDYTF